MYFKNLFSGFKKVLLVLEDVKNKNGQKEKLELEMKKENINLAFLDNLKINILKNKLTYHYIGKTNFKTYRSE